MENQTELPLDEIYYDLKNPPLILTSKVNKLFKRFADLMATKPSFASRVHTSWSKLINKKK